MTKKMKILIAYDGSDCAEAALDDLQRAGLPSVVESLVMSVTEIWLPVSTSPTQSVRVERHISAEPASMAMSVTR